LTTTASYGEAVARLIHLNGAPGIGKSTLARRYAEDHPGILVCDIDVLRTLVAGWQEDFHEAGTRIRTTALATITSYLQSGHDVVLPQFVARAEELARFRSAAARGEAQYVGVVLTAEPRVVIDRFRTRSVIESDDPLVAAISEVVEGLGGADVIAGSCTDLDVLADQEQLLRVPSTAPEETYGALLLALGERR